MSGQGEIRVYLPGPVGPPIVNVGSFNAPMLISSAIPAPTIRRQRIFIAGNGAPIDNPSIPTPGDNGPWELYLFVTSDSNTITLDDQSNIKLSGQWIGKAYSQICLHWDGNSKYVEDHRNEI